MDKPKELSMWTVARNVDDCSKIIWYGSFSELIEENGEHYVEIPFDNWLSEDLAEIFCNKLEYGNYHSWTWLPESLLTAMVINKLPEKERFDILLRVYNDWLYE